MNFKILSSYINVESYLSNFLKVSKKNIHNIRMHSHHYTNTIIINGQSADLQSKLNKGDNLEINIELGTSNYIANNSLSIIKEYEDDYLLIVNKPQGTASIPSQLHPDQSMANRVKGYLQSTRTQDCVTHVVTRLDRDTTGVMMFAKHRVVHAWMDQALRNKTIQKTYHAIVTKQDVLKEHDFIDAPIGRTDD